MPAAAANDTAITAVAVSRDGARVASFGGAPEYNVTVHDTTTGEALTPSQAVKAPALVTRAALCPGNPDLLAACGPAGVYFYRLHKSHTSLEMTLTKGEVPAAEPDAEIGRAHV